MDRAGIPITGKTIHHDAVLRDALGQRERAGAGQMLRHIAAERLRRDDHAGAIRQHGDQRRVGLRQMQAHGVGIDHLHRGDRLQLALAHALGRGAIALQVGLHRVGVERLAVVEFHAVAQRERQRQIVRRPFPGRGELRHEVVLRVEVDQLVAHGGEDDAADECAAAGGVQRVRVLVQADAQRGRLRRPRQQQVARQAAPIRAAYHLLRHLRRQNEMAIAPRQAPSCPAAGARACHRTFTELQSGGRHLAPTVASLHGRESEGSS